MKGLRSVSSTSSRALPASRIRWSVAVPDAFDIDHHVGFDDQYIAHLVLIAMGVKATRCLYLHALPGLLDLFLRSTSLVVADLVDLLFREAHVAQLGERLPV